jgi:hypothetical protein
MFSSYVRSVKRNVAAGTVIAHCEIIDDRTNTTVRFDDYTGITKQDIVDQALAALNTLKAAETDAALNLAYVGKLIATV